MASLCRTGSWISGCNGLCVLQKRRAVFASTSSMYFVSGLYEECAAKTAAGKAESPV